MARFVTLTPNPALDISVEVERIEPGRKLRTGEARLDPGGGGLNAARAIHELGGDVRALYVAGGEVGRRLKRLLDAQPVETRLIEIEGETREGFTALDRGTDGLYRFVLPGPTLTRQEWRGCIDVLAEELEGAEYLIASGSLPPGVPADFYARVARLASELEVRTVLDGPGAALASGLEEGVYAIKPNWREFDDLIGNPEGDDVRRERAAERIVAEGGAEIVVVTLGSWGGRVTTTEGHLHVHPPHVHPVSAVGAGDSFAGAMTLMLARGEPIEFAARYGMAAATATQISPGTRLCTLEDTERFAERVTIERPAASA